MSPSFLQDNLTTGDFEDSTSLLDDPKALREKFAHESHVLLRGLLDPAAVSQVRDDIAAALRHCDFVGPPDDSGVGLPMGPSAVRETNDASYLTPYTALQRQQSFHELAYAAPLLAAVRVLLGDELLVHPRKIARITPPDPLEFATAPHQDFRLIQGTADVVTAWIPMVECPRDLGGLRIMAGSHQLGLRQIQPALGPGGVQAALPDDPGLPWLGADFRAGDVLLFHSLTVHAALPNVTTRLRLSADYRYQRRGEPVLVGSLKPHFFDVVPDWDVLTEGWTSTRSIEVPPNLVVVDPFDLDDPDIRTPASSLVSSDQERE